MPSSSEPYKELLVARYNDALRRVKGHAATDEMLMRMGEPRDSDATKRLREEYSRARFELHCYLGMLGGVPEDRERLDAIARGDGYDDWLTFHENGNNALPCDPPPSDHGANGPSLKAW